MAVGAIVKVVEAWIEEYLELAALGWVRSVQIFENRGEMMGASNLHPHCQIWASESLPNELAKEEASQRAWAEAASACLLCSYLELERAAPERIVCENEFFTGLVPFWAVWPFETLVLPRRHCRALDDLGRDERAGLAEILKRLTTRYDNLFEAPFPYTMGFHQRPTDSAAHPHFHLHAHFYPPLLRSATIRKFMVGFEMLGSPQRDITPEAAAERLRGVSEQHYLDR
jgi:UDPglucose--hexose-1-phosphate uridylyltransferase